MRFSLRWIYFSCYHLNSALNISSSGVEHIVVVVVVVAAVVVVLLVVVVVVVVID